MADSLGELIERARTMSADDRATLLGKLRANEPRLADELAKQLADEAAAKTQLGVGVGDLAETADIPAGAPLPKAAYAERMPSIDGYRAIEILGEGGMGTVYLGEQREPRRPVAIKMLHARSSEALARFKAEARIMARLDHSGIARVLEAGEADGQPYLVMEHVDGVTLDRHVEKLPIARRLELFASVCDAVHHAHLSGVIHRDLKPSNVMVRPDGRVVVLDFGLARVADAGADSAKTHAGELLGTPLYMSPEQARLRPDEVDARTDVYTLGVILYELASDRLPYGEHGMPIAALSAAILTDDPIPLGKRDAELRGDLEAIVMTTLAKEPRDRYHSAAALADDVRRFLRGDQVMVRVPGAIERARRFVRRRPLLAAAIVGSVLAGAAFSATVTKLWIDARAARRVADDARDRVEHANVALESRTNQLVLRQARAALARDPTEALAWLRTLGDRDVDAGVAWAIAGEARARGVASLVQRVHVDEVHWVEPLPGDDGFVTGSYDGRAGVWVDGAFGNVFAADRGRVHAARPSPDGSLIAIGGDDGELHVQAFPVGAKARELLGHKGDVQHLSWSADGAWLATADDHGNAWLWPHGEAPGVALAHVKHSIGAIAFAERGDALTAGDHDGNVWLWHASAPDRALTTTAGAELAELWTDGERVIGADNDGVVHEWRVDGDKLVVAREVKTGQRVKRATFAPGGAYAVLGGVGGAVVVVDGDDYTTLWSYRAQVRSLAVAPDGRMIAAGSDDGDLEIHDRATGRHLPLRGHGSRIRHVAFTRGGALLSSDADGVVRRWDLAALPAALLDDRAPIERMIAARDGTRLAAVDARGEVSLWTLADAGRARVGRAVGRAIAIAIVASPRSGDSDRRSESFAVVTGSAEGDVVWWMRAPLHRTIAGSVKSIAAAPDRVAVATSAGPIAMFDAAGAPLAALDGNPGGTEAVAFDPRGALLASGGQDRKVRVWRRDGDDYVAAAALDGPRGDTHYVAFDPAGEVLVSAGNDGQVLAWSVKGGAIVDPMPRVVARHTGAVTALRVTRAWIASAGRDGTITRAPLRGGAAESTTVAAAPIALAIDDAGAIRAVTRAGAGLRWTSGDAVVEIEHGLLTGEPLDDGRWAQAFADGAIVIAPARTGTLAELRAEIARATSYVLPR